MVPWPFGASTTSKNIQMFQADSDPFHPDLGDPWEPLQTPHPHGKHCWTHLRYLRFELLASWDDEQSSTHKMVLDSGTHGIPKTPSEKKKETRGHAEVPKNVIGPPITINTSTLGCLLLGSAFGNKP